MKATYTKILARKILLAFLAFTVILFVVAFVVRKGITEKLENISNAANNIKHEQDKPEHILLLLHQAENDFQESLFNNDHKRSNDYKLKLSQAFQEIDTLLKQQVHISHLTSDQNRKVDSWYRKKIKLSERLSNLKHDFDSLLTAYAGFNAENSRLNMLSKHNVYKVSKVTKSHADTLVKNVEVRKKGLLGRIKDAIANKNSPTPSNVIVNNANTTDILDTITPKISYVTKKYTTELKQLQQRNTKLLLMQRELIALNTNINDELEYIVNNIKEINYNMASDFREILFKNYQDTTLLLNKFYLSALFILIVFAVLLIIFIIQLNTAELLLRKEIERSVTMAQQKMDLLLHMSHEIRNPLTAIMGFLYVFSKTKLEKKQEQMLDAIRTSSDMLLQTLNDTLDAAKLESNEFKINIEPFNPDYVLRSVIDSMQINASNKSLTIDYIFKGDKDAILLGDHFRLRQIMVNLLSNAIKYTDKGGVTIAADLSSAENKLYVDIIDTGVGISEEQQSNLFSKYYQTSSSKGQVGTGLGLFICKQLINLQGGKISIKSRLNEGSAFSFSIPYKKNSGSAKSKLIPKEPALLLNGICVLGIDDNELNLMTVQMILKKYNAIFFKTSSGKEALEIIAKNKINIVLTDIHMPGMDGNELLVAIRKLVTPFNKLPVIAITGTTDEEEINEYMRKGFSGVVSKPFTSAHLLDELVKVLQID